MTSPVRLRASDGWFLEQERRLLDFGRGVVRADNLAHWLADDGTPDPTKPAHTYMTARMAYVHTLGAMRGVPGCAPLAARLMEGLTTTAADHRYGGFFDAPLDDPTGDKQTYTHAFVILAAATAALAGRSESAELLTQTLETTVERFGEPGRPLFADAASADFAQVRDYRGINANMHMVEALLAATAATGDSQWAERANSICRFVIDQASTNNWRIPEHYDRDWQPLLQYNADKPADQFRPFGATVGHAFEWARLLVQTSRIEIPGTDGYLQAAQQLVDRAVADGWARSDIPGFAYTTDWTGEPIVDDRLFWVAAEAVGAAQTLWQATGDARYRNWWAQWWDHIADVFIDYRFGSWHHQLDPQNRPTSTIWSGKPDLYHAYQAVLLALLPAASTIPGAVVVDGAGVADS